MEKQKFPYRRPAFPNTGDDNEWTSGITIRDYFAAKAMEGLISAFKGDVSAEFDIISIVSYKMADAMINQREQ